MSILQSTQFVVQQLYISSKDGKVQYDVLPAFDELNIFDSISLPCMSGNILIRDAVGLSTKAKFDGSEYINIKIVKDPDNPDLMWFDKKFVIYKQTDRKAINQSSEQYVLHFVSEELFLSKQKKVRRSYKGTHSDIVQRILKDYLAVENKVGETSSIEKTKGLHQHYINNMSPFDAIEHVTKRAINAQGLPNYVFYQTQQGYNFVSLSTLNAAEPIIEVEFGTKNLSKNLDIASEVYGARDVKIVSQFNYAENIESG